MAMSETPKVFVSYSSSDRAKVRKICQGLRSRGIDCWFDDDSLSIGDSLYHEINSALMDSEFVLFCVSESALRSGWVEREVGGALAEQIRKQERRILPVLLDDSRPPALLGDVVWADLSSADVTDGVSRLARAIHAHKGQRSVSGPKNLAQQADSEIRKLAGLRVAPNFHWIIVSGPSSAGKDVLAYIAIQNLQVRHSLLVATKYTTRPRRPSEPEYVVHLPDEEFDRGLAEGIVLFPFIRRTHRYGFSTKQFRNAVQHGTPMLSVLTDFERVPIIASSMNAIGLPTTPFFIRVPKQDLLRRILFRNLPADEVKGRIASIEQDYREMAARRTLEEEYTFVENGDDRAFREASEELTRKIRDVLVSGAAR